MISQFATKANTAYTSRVLVRNTQHLETQRRECPTQNFLLGIHDNTPRIPNDAIPNHGILNDAIPNHGIPNNGMSSNYIRYNMQWVFRRCLTGIPNDGMPNDGIPNNGMSSNYIRYNM